MPDVETGRHIANRVTQAREYLEISEHELADMIEVDAGEILAIEAGEKEISAPMLVMVSRALGKSLEFFTADVPAQTVDARTQFLARAAETLSAQDMDELERFATYLRSRTADPAN